ncbi:oxygen-insensitive NADPH nitroreductase [Marinomonas sp. M1K-6]|uniref:Oxygen-insensitive NADPH nitroreductase n=1 Tax=Marinomonas profundi TaxID=2726122 RepID=A0A847QW33_9GAMM|nr:oxygen-insensitive NADPH nitroreductase [Marinomonas profundi]NLQ17438.1 oxygen-insensitive NADPH nitroreductase [Marinomonas profundi]UDV01962.1 oxygen-insensitive NADPH nitroreductase [Marinomonas profundi]
MNPILQAQNNHKSIRQYTEQAIDPVLLQQLIQSAQGAASSSFIQAYSLVQVTIPENRHQIATLAGGQKWVESAAEFFVICADLTRVEYCSLEQGLGELEGNTEHFIAATTDATFFAQNLMLGAESVGLGAVFIGGIRNDPAQVAELLNLPNQVYPIFGLCLGYPDAEPDLKPRLPVDVILHKDSYDSSRCASDVNAYDAQMQAYYQSRGDNQKASNWSEQTAAAVQKKKREHMLGFLQQQGFLKR